MGRSAPAATETSVRPENSRMRIAFAVVFSSVWLPATVVTPRSSISGLASARRSAIASSWPGSQSRIIGSAKDLVHLVGGRKRGLGAGPGRRYRPGRACAAQRLVPVAGLEVRDDKAGGEGVASRGSVDCFHLWWLCPRDFLAVLQQDGALRSERECDELPAGVHLMLVAVHDKQVGLDVDGPRRRRVEAEERCSARCRHDG